MRVFDPNTNPYADDLIRLALAPATRYLQHERRALAEIMAIKLYQVNTHDRWPRDFPYLYIGRDLNWHEVGIKVIFEFERDVAMEVISRDFVRYEELVVLSVGAQGVVEVFNGRPEGFERKKIKAALSSLWDGHRIEKDRGEGIVPIRSDKEAADDYQGRRGRDGSNGDGNGGDGGDGDGDGPGPGGMPGSGGTRELINHPILFAVEPGVFDAIMEQV